MKNFSHTLTVYVKYLLNEDEKIFASHNFVCIIANWKEKNKKVSVQNFTSTK